jgi:hypothetical protein
MQELGKELFLRMHCCHLYYSLLHFKVIRVDH